MMNSKTILSATRSLPDIPLPVRSSRRLTYHCIAASRNIICIGASTGSIYVFDRHSGRLLQFISNKVNPVVELKFSHDERLLAAADSSGLITCWEIFPNTQEFKIAKEIDDFNGTVTAMCWSDTTQRLFVGGESGLVMAFSVGFVGFSKSSVETIRKTGDPVIQMDFCRERLVISSTTKAILCYTDRSQFQQIGTKPRDGIYGACFLSTPQKNQPKIYSARPGSRLWEVDFSGQVLATHQFKELLAIPPTPIITNRSVHLCECNLTSCCQPQSFNFQNLQPLMGRFLLTWSPRGIYIFEPQIGDVLCWNDQIKDIVGLCCQNDSIYVLHTDSSVTEIQLLSLKHCLLSLLKHEEWTKLAEVACCNREEILENVELFLSIDFRDVLSNIKESDRDTEDIISQTKTLIKELEERHAEVCAAVQERLNKGLQDSVLPPITGEDNDDVRSNVSEGVSEGSSRISLTRLAEMNFDNLVQKATTAVVTKVIGAGFMKKAFREALHAEGVILNEPSAKQDNVKAHQKILNKTQSVPNSPKSQHGKLQRATSDKELSTVELLQPGKMHKKSNSVPSLAESAAENAVKKNLNYENHDEIVVQRGRTRRSSRRKKKAKVVSIDSPPVIIASPEELSVTDGVEVTNPSDIEQIPCNVSSNSTVERKADRMLSSTDAETNFFADMSNCEKFILQLPINSGLIINQLVSITAATRNNFRDPGVLYNSKAIHDILESWSLSLSSIANQFQEECFKSLDKYIQDNMTAAILSHLKIESNKLLFTQLSAAFSEISNVATLCLETEILPDKCSHLQPYEIALLNFDLSYQSIHGKAQEDFERIYESKKLATVRNGNENLVQSTEEENMVSDISIENLGSDETEQSPSADASKINCISTNMYVPNNSVNKNDEVSASFDLFLIGTENDKNKILYTNPASSDSELKSSYHVESVMSQIYNKDINDLLFDRHSLSTIVSETETMVNDIKVEDGLFDVLCHDLIDFEILCENFNAMYGACEACELDKCRACFVLRYFPVLDFSRIRNLLIRKGSCRWRTWLACMAHIRDTQQNSQLYQAILAGNLSVVTSVVESSGDVEVFLANIQRLVHMTPKLLSSYISNGSLKPWEVCILYHTEFLSYKNDEDFLHYAHQEIIQMSHVSDPLLLRCSLHTALKYQPNYEEIFCDCRKPKPGSNTINWQWQDLLVTVIDVSCQCKLEHNKIWLVKLCELCEKNGFWLGYLKLLCKVDNMEDTLNLLYQLGDYDLLEDIINQGIFSPNEDTWTNLLLEVTKADAANHKCHAIDGWNPTLSLEKIIKIIARQSSSGFVLQAIRKLENVSLSCDLYTRLLKTSKMESNQDALVSSLVEVVSGNIWSEKKRLIHSELEVLKNTELQGDETTNIFPGSILSNEFVMDESDTIWGRSVNISSAECPVCTLPLCLKTTTTASVGLIIFQCGHRFHKICLPENACLVPKLTAECSTVILSPYLSVGMLDSMKRVKPICNPCRIDTIFERQEPVCSVMEAVTLQTDFGDLKVEVFCEDSPKTCENFLALCASGYYNGCLFHRNMRGFMVQTGDPTGTGKGGKSIWGGKFADEIVPHLKHNARGILSMANSGADTNGSQFFITFAKQPHLDMKYTIFGKVLDGFDVLDDFEKLQVNEKNFRPVDEVRIRNVIIHANPLAE